MDEPITKRRRSWVRPAVLASVVALPLLVWALMAKPGLVVARESVVIQPVEVKVFRESIVVQGTIEPQQVVVLDVTMAGRVDQVFVREGEHVVAGGPLLQLSNPDLELEVLRHADQLQRATDRQQEILLDVDRERRHSRDQRREIAHTLALRRLDYQAQADLHERRLAAEVDYLKAREEVLFWEGRLAEFETGMEEEQVFHEARIAQAHASVERWEQSLTTVQNRLDRMLIRAPIDGVLSSLTARLGEAKAVGDRLGQVDGAEFEILAEIDQIYSARIAVNQAGSVQPAGMSGRLDVVVREVLAEVVNGRFEVRLKLLDKAAGRGLRRGQRVTVRLFLGDSLTAHVVPKGPYHQQTGGRWIFVVADDGGSAIRRDITLGRQNDDYYEVISGLREGEAVITSRYDPFGERSRLILE